MPRANFQTLIPEQPARKLQGEATLHGVSAELSVSHSATVISTDVDSTSVHNQGSQNIHNGNRFNRILAGKGGSLVNKIKLKEVALQVKYWKCLLKDMRLNFSASAYKLKRTNEKKRHDEKEMLLEDKQITLTS